MRSEIAIFVQRNTARFLLLLRRLLLKKVKELPIVQLYEAHSYNKVRRAVPIPQDRSSSSSSSSNSSNARIDAVLRSSCHCHHCWGLALLLSLGDGFIWCGATTGDVSHSIKRQLDTARNHSKVACA